MKMSVTQRLILMAAIATGTVLGPGAPEALPQQRLFRQTQYESPPSLDLPSPSSEASMFPTMDEVVPPSIQQATEPMLNGAPFRDDYPAGTMLHEGEPRLEMQPPFVDQPSGEYLEPQSYFGTDGPAPIYSTGTWWWRGNWYTRLDVVVLDRSDVRDNLLIFDPATNIPYTNNDLAQFNYEGGMRLTLGSFLGRDASHRDHMTEISYLGLFNWNAGRTLTSSAPGNTLDTLLINAAAATGAATVFFDASSQSFFYSSGYNDFQWNYRLQTRPGKDAMALQPNGMWVQHAVAGQVRSFYFGMRLTTLDESVAYSSNRTVNNVDENAQYLVSTNNDMFGFHYGGQFDQVHDDWSWGAKAGAGTLLNFIDRLSTLESNVSEPLTQKLTDERFTWVLEAGIFAKYQVRPNLMLRAGYDVIYYANVSLAAENLGFLNGFPELITDAPVYYHGGSAGFEATW